MGEDLYSFDKPNFRLARLTAYKLLLAQAKPYIGMRAENITVPGKSLIFDTLQNYARDTHTSLFDLTANGKISLGCHINFDDKLYLLLHNDNITYDPCLNWTNIHEIGHICLGHRDNGDREEVEAHFFASCLLMPDAVIRYMEVRGCKINISFLTEYFGVSPDAAARKLLTMDAGTFTTAQDDQIISVMRKEIDYIVRDVTRPCFGFINFASL